MSLKDKITVEWEIRTGSPIMAATASLALEYGQLVDRSLVVHSPEFKSEIEDKLKEEIMHFIYGGIYTPLMELKTLAHRGDMCGEQYYHEKIEALVDEILKITQDKK